MGRARMYDRVYEKRIRATAQKALVEKGQKTDTFPNCRSTFDNCPTEEEINSLLEKKQAPSVCGKCPVFQEKPPKGIIPVRESLMTPENEEFYRKNFMGK